MRKNGLDWLADRGRITHRQKLAGEKYGTDWRRSQPQNSPLLEARAHAEAMLARTRILALNGNKALAEACDQVCGVGLKPRDWAGGDDRLAGRYEERIQRSLELLERYYFG